jgi:hypothetical protein
VGLGEPETLANPFWDDLDRGFLAHDPQKLENDRRWLQAAAQSLWLICERPRQALEVKASNEILPQLSTGLFTETEDKILWCR